MEGDDARVNRSAAQTTRFVLFVNDTIKAEGVSGPAVNVSFNVTNTSNNYLLAGVNETNTSGYAVFYFDPNETYEVGEQNWTAYVAGDAAYKDNTTPAVYNVTIIGDLLINMTQPDGEDYIQGQDNVTVKIYVKDDADNNMTNGSGDMAMMVTFINETGATWNCNLVEEGDGWYNCTFPT